MSTGIKKFVAANWRRLMNFFTVKTGSLPVGIWLVWIALAYAFGGALKSAAVILGFMQAQYLKPELVDVFIPWIALIAAVVSLLRRRLVSRIFIGIVLAFVLQGAILHMDAFGILLALAGFLGMLANRRWFDECLPKVYVD